HLDGEFTYEKWFEGFRAGRVIVTNGPLIRPLVEGELSGHVFRADAGQEVELEIGLTLSTRDKISYLEIVKDGRAVHEVRLDEFAKKGGKLPPLRFTESGWFLGRAVTDLSNPYRFAITAPYFVEIDYKPRISRGSAQFFLDWLDARAKKLKPHESDNRVREFWQGILDKANVD